MGPRASTRVVSIGLKTAFPGGKPEEKKDDAKKDDEKKEGDKKPEEKVADKKPDDSLKETKQDNVVILVGDADFLGDGCFHHRQIRI